VFLGVWAVSPGGRAEARAALPTVLAALAVTAAVAGALLAYPLWMHFAGPQSFAGTGFNQRVYAESVAAYGSYPARSLAGVAGLNSTLAPNPTEETSFFGLPLLALVFTGWGMLWRDASTRRRATLRALAATGAVFAVLSFGPRLKTLGIPTAVPLPYAVLGRLPLFNAALPARFALVVVGVIGVLLALTADRLLTRPGRGRGWRTAWAAGFAVALIPIVPAPLLWAWRAPIPTFVASGAWQRYVPDGGALTALPLASNALPDGQRWQAYTLAAGGPQFAMPGGYFLGPDLDGRGRIGALPRPTDRLFTLAAQYGLVLPVDRSDQAQAQADFAYWGVRVVILPDHVTPAQWPVYYEAVRQTATALLGPPERVDDVWLWRITATGAVTGAR
jgi:hypothetical protein